MGKNPNFGFVFSSGHLHGDKGSVLSGSEYFYTIRFVFCNYVGFGFFIDEIGSCFRGGHLLWINCNCKYQLID